MGRLLLATGLLLAFGGAGVGAYRVVQLERRELQAGSGWAPLAETERVGRGEAVRHRIATAELQQGESMEVELCTRDGMPASSWRDALAFEMLYVPEGDVVVRAPVDEARLARARRNERGACLTLAQGSELPIGGRYAVDATWPVDSPPPEAVVQAPVRARVLAWTPLSPLDRWPVLVALLGALLVPLSLLSRPRAVAAKPRDGSGATPAAGPSPLQLVAGVGALVLVGAAVSFVPFGGSTVGLAQGLALAAVQVAAAFALVRASRGSARRVLALAPPGRWWLLLLAPVVGLALRFVGGLVARLVPSTSEAPIETFVSMPSGTLALATVAVLVPLAEELFFRGFVWGAAERWLGSAAAFFVTVALFVLAHVPQLWGAWGSLASVTITGLVLTGLRWWSGSLVVPAVAHLAHNGVIVAFALSG